MKNKLFLDLAESTFKNNNYKLEESIKNDIKTTFFAVDEEKKKYLKRDVGQYFTICFKENALNNYPKTIKKEIIKVLRHFKKAIPNYGTTLIIGLGNSSILCDSLGQRRLIK